jgi:hypothetical protein
MGRPTTAPTQLNFIPRAQNLGETIISYQPSDWSAVLNKYSEQDTKVNFTATCLVVLAFVRQIARITQSLEEVLNNIHNVK